MLRMRAAVRIRKVMIFEKIALLSSFCSVIIWIAIKESPISAIIPANWRNAVIAVKAPNPEVPRYRVIIPNAITAKRVFMTLATLWMRVLWMIFRASLMVFWVESFSGVSEYLGKGVFFLIIVRIGRGIGAVFPYIYKDLSPRKVLTEAGQNGSI